MSARLIAMSGPDEINFRDLSNFEAGVAFLGMVNQVYPGIRFSQLADLAFKPETMNGFWDAVNPMSAVRAVTKTLGNVKDGIGDVLKDTFSSVGDGAGSAIRLVTDEKVLDGASKLYAAYLTQGGSESAGGIMDFISSLGATAKDKTAATGGLPGGILPWALGGGGLLLVVVMLSGRR